jgi:putative addiction module CopG family antidote
VNIDELWHDIAMEVLLTAELEAFIQEKVRTGRYADASDVVREALRKPGQTEDFASPELEAVLLEGIQSPHRTYGADTLERVRRSAPAQ